MNFAVPAEHKAKKKKNRKERQLLRSCQRTKKTMEYEEGSWNIPKGLERKLEELEIGGWIKTIQSKDQP